MRQIIGLTYLAGIVMATIAVAVFIVTCNIGFGNNSIKSKNGIHFIDGAISKATALSKKEHKPIFLLAYANYCSACKKMKNEVFSQKEIDSIFNKEFINYSVDIESK
ncbi:MAG: thioredoxin family protein [Bacteroidetes bacterium]|nr:thioredoxin family protein [Bacteroidota bacterium]